MPVAPSLNIRKIFRTYNGSEKDRISIVSKSRPSSPVGPLLETKPFENSSHADNVISVTKSSDCLFYNPVHSSFHAAEVDEDIETMKQEISRLNEKTAKTSRKAVSTGLDALESMQHIMMSLPSQSERLSNTEVALSGAIRGAEDGHRKINKLQQTQYMIHNPLSSNRHERRIIGGSITSHQDERKRHEIIRLAAGHEASWNNNYTLDEIPYHDVFSDYEFEPDEEDVNISRDIHESFEALKTISRKLNYGAQIIGTVISGHNEKADTLAEKVVDAHNKVARNKAELDRFRC
jgi:hypothetical protein